MKPRPNLLSLSLAQRIFLLAIGLGLTACEPPLADNSADERAYTQPALAGQSWNVIDDQDNRVLWRRVQNEANDTGAAIFEIAAEEPDSRNLERLEITIKSQDRVFVTRKDISGNISCNYTGRIWVETDLESYNAFSEDTDPNKRPAFYRIITGTYRCDGMNESRTWAAKINE